MKVSVAMVTYNHEAFIAEALDSALAQVVDFDLEIVVSDDCSTDRTPEILADYQRRHPEVVKAALNETNLGANANFVATLARCRGEYLALLDGDDYWTSPHKVRRQVRQLDADPGLALVFHSAVVLRGEGRRRVWHPPGRRARYDLGDLLKGNFIATGSVMCRNGPAASFPDWYDESKGMPGDWVLFSRLARTGDIGYLDEPMSVYRQHDDGIWSAASRVRVRRLRSLLEIGRRLDADFDHDYTRSVRRAALVTRVKIAVARLAPFVVSPLAALRDRLRS